MAAWLILAPFVLTRFTGSGRVNDIAVGVALVALTLPRGPVRERYAGWDRFIR